MLIEQEGSGTLALTYMNPPTQNGVACIIIFPPYVCLLYSFIIFYHKNEILNRSVCGKNKLKAAKLKEIAIPAFTLFRATPTKMVNWSVLALYLQHIKQNLKNRFKDPTVLYWDKHRWVTLIGEFQSSFFFLSEFKRNLNCGISWKLEDQN